MWKFLRDYFTFTRTELRIILILSVLLLAGLCFRLYSGLLFTPADKPSDDEIRLVKEFIASLEFTDSNANEKIKAKSEVFYNHLKVFDPNRVLVRDLREMGFPKNVISNISKYKKSGGRFFKPREFKKIYGVADSAFIKIAPYISIIDSVRKEKIPSKINVQVFKEVEIINLNTTDSAHLVTLRGIGPSYARRIIKYRNRLGGFIVPEQLLEIFGMDSTRFELFKAGIYIDTADVKKIDINNVVFSELVKHPYMDEQTAASIIKFRNFKGRIKDIQELDSYNILQKDKLKKIEPYLCISPEN